MFFIPSGALHHIENLDNSNGVSVAEFILAFSHESPKDFDLSNAFSAM
jgi:oxalate decarboxylase